MKRDDPLWFLHEINWGLVDEIYLNRLEAQWAMVDALPEGASMAFAQLALGMVDPHTNHCADAHELGPKILAENAGAAQRIWALAQHFEALKEGGEVPAIIEAAQISHLGVGIGSELACMINPQVNWVARPRSIWAHFLIELGGIHQAGGAVAAYRDTDLESVGYWPRWRTVHREMGPNMQRILEVSLKPAQRAKLDAPFLWVDAICDATYRKLAGPSGPTG